MQRVVRNLVTDFFELGGRLKLPWAESGLRQLRGAHLSENSPKGALAPRIVPK